MIRDRAFLTTYSIIRNAMRCFTASLISKAIDNVAREDVCLTIYRAIHDAISNQLVSFHVAFAAFGSKLHERAFKSQESRVSTEQPTRRLKLPQECEGSRAGAAPWREPHGQKVHARGRSAYATDHAAIA